MIVIAEQLNFADLILQVMGSSNFVNVVTVHVFEIHVSFEGQLSLIVMFLGIWRVKVWNNGLEEVPAVALIDWSAQHVRPTTCISWLNNSADFDKIPSWGIIRYLDLSPVSG